MRPSTSRFGASAILLAGASFVLTACGGDHSSSVTINDALFSSTLMFVGTQLHIYGEDLADFNGDGLDDTAFSAERNVSNQYVDFVYFQRGSATQGIEDPVLLGQGEYVGHGDFNADGIDDVLALIDTPSNTSDQLAIYFCRPDDTFDGDARIDIPFDEDDINDLAIGDINGDGAADVLFYTLISGVPRLTAFLNDGDGESFTGPTYDATDILQGDFLAKDVDGDGFDDLIDQNLQLIPIPHAYMGARIVNFSDGAGGFTGWTPVFYQNFPLSLGRLKAFPEPYDFTGDGILDFVTHILPGIIDVYAGAPDRTFANVPIATDTGRDDETLVCFVFDANDDGALDIVFRQLDGDTYASYVALGDGAGRFPAIIQIPCGEERPFAASDVNQDSIPDLLTTAHWSTSMRNVYFGDGEGNFSAEQPMPQPVPLAGQLVHAPNSAVNTVDVDADGFADLVTIGEHEDTLSILYGRIGGEFEPLVTLDIDRPMVPVDLDGDGPLEFLGLSSLQGYVSILRNYGGRDLRALPPIQLAADVLLTAKPDDFDGDDVMDIVLSLPDARAALAYGSGNLQFDPTVFVSGAPNHQYTRAHDINGDDYKDFVSFEGPWSAPFPVNPSAFSVIPGGPGHTFDTPVQSNAQTTGESSFDANGSVVVFGDLNNDGRMDAVAGDRLAGPIPRTRMLIYFGQADATLTLQQELVFSHYLTYPRLADLDNDDDLDLVVFAFQLQFLELGPGHLYVHTHLNDGTGLFASSGSSAFLSYFLSTSDWTAEVLDITSDGIPDAFAHFPVLGFTVAPGQNDGSLGQPYYFAANGFGFPVAADFDQDGDTDFAALTHLRTEIGLFFNRTFRD